MPSFKLTIVVEPASETRCLDCEFLSTKETAWGDTYNAFCHLFYRTLDLDDRENALRCNECLEAEKEANQ